MKRTKYFLLLMLLPALFPGCRQNKAIPDGSLVAFSLREAQRILLLNSSRPDSALITLGGITRLAGMVIDCDNNDIILVGKKSSQLPEACFDDLVIALRARMVHDELPMVSIDPVENTHITRKQEVRFGGQIENTSFGKVFLDSDILLKKYSLELEQQIQGVESYKQLILNDEINTLLQNGISPVSIDWVDMNQISNFYGESMESETTNQARFWFNYKDPYRVRIRGDVFCIMSLNIIVEREVQPSELNANNELLELAAASPDILFADGFSSNFFNLSETYPVLKKMKLLFDMTAIAEGLKQTINIPDLHYILNEYNVSEIPTQKDFDLIEKCAVIERSDGKISLVQISGGIASTVEVEWLNAGDVSYLKEFTLDSRPDKSSLFWKIPLDQWEMPNSTGIIKSVKKQDDLSMGCRFSSSSIELNPAIKSHNQFGGFKPQPYADPINTKGVQMRMEIDSLHFTRVDSLRILKDRILNK